MCFVFILATLNKVCLKQQFFLNSMIYSGVSSGKNLKELSRCDKARIKSLEIKNIWLI